MIATLLASLLLTVVAVWWSRRLAAERARRVGAWALATALLPPVVLVLWVLPARAFPPEPSPG